MHTENSYKHCNHSEQIEGHEISLQAHSIGLATRLIQFYSILSEL